MGKYRGGSHKKSRKGRRSNKKLKRKFGSIPSVDDVYNLVTNFDFAGKITGKPTDKDPKSEIDKEKKSINNMIYVLLTIFAIFEVSKYGPEDDIYTLNDFTYFLKRTLIKGLGLRTLTISLNKIYKYIHKKLYKKVPEEDILSRKRVEHLFRTFSVFKDWGDDVKKFKEDQRKYREQH